jgi:hypothetical protein
MYSFYANNKISKLSNRVIKSRLFAKISHLFAQQSNMQAIMVRVTNTNEY